jgi:hypothetical protein
MNVIIDSIGNKFFCENYEGKKGEDNLEKDILKFSSDIFGPNSLYLNKKIRLSSLGNLGSVPDGYLIDFRNNKFYLVEVELEKHDIVGHVMKQLAAFVSCFNKPENKKRIVDSIYEEIEANKPQRNKAISRWLNKDTYHVLTKLIFQYSKPAVILIVDNISTQLIEIESTLEQNISLDILDPIEFKKYRNKNKLLYKFDIFSYEKPGGGLSKTNLPGMQELFEKGILGKGDKIMIKGKDDLKARVVSGKNVVFKGKVMTYNQWGQEVTGWPSINIYLHAVHAKSGKTLNDLRSKT